MSRPTYQPDQLRRLGDFIERVREARAQGNAIWDGFTTAKTAQRAINGESVRPASRTLIQEALELRPNTVRWMLEGNWDSLLKAGNDEAVQGIIEAMHRQGDDPGGVPKSSRSA